MVAKAPCMPVCFFLSLMLIMNSMIMPIQAEVDPLIDAEENLLKISDEEQKVLDVLYKLEQEIQKAERDGVTILENIEATKIMVATTQVKIDEEALSYEQNKGVLASLLKSYQKRGPGSTIEVILASENLRDLLRRLTILRDLTKQSNDLLDKIDQNKQTLEAEGLALEAQVISLEAEQDRLAVVVEEKSAAREEQEAYLSSLLEERAHFEDLLEEITLGWEALKPLFTRASQGFTSLAESGALPPEALDLRITLTGIEAGISAGDFNKAVVDNDLIPEMVFDFRPGEIELSIPESRLVLNGNFELSQTNVLVFEAQSGTFYDVPLEASAIEELFALGKLTLDLNTLTGDNQIKGVKSIEDKLLLSIKVKLF